MRTFDFKTFAARLLTNDRVNMLGMIHEYKEMMRPMESKNDLLSMAAKRIDVFLLFVYN